MKLGLAGGVEISLVVGAQRLAAGDEVGVDEEMGDAGVGDEGFQAGAVARIVVEN